MRLHSIMKFLQWPFRVIAEVALVGLVVITAIDVLGRVLFSSPLGFAYELIGVLLGVAVYSGLIGMNWTREHVRIDLIAKQLRAFPRFNRLRAYFVWLLELTFFTIVAIYVARQATQLHRWHETFMFLPSEKWLPLAVFAVFAALAAMCTLLSVFSAPKSGDEDLK